MPISGSSNSMAKKRRDVKNMDKWGYSYLIELKTLWEKEKLLVMSNFSFSQNVVNSCLLLMHQNEYLWSKGLNILRKMPFKNIVGKGENAGEQHLIIFPFTTILFFSAKGSFE